jgi:protein transport protein SEC61 subunit gamma-like protein
MTAGKNNRKEKDDNVVAQLTTFAHNSKHFFEKCRKPDKEEYLKIMYACFMGFVVMGFIGYAVKLIFIPINNILLSA